MTPFVYCSVPARFFQACKALFGSCLLLFALAGCGGGGGRPNLAQAGGRDGAALDGALEQAKTSLQQELQG